MNVKEILKQAFYLDHQINCKLEQVDQLNALARKATSTLTDMPKSKHQNNSRMEEVIIKILALEEEINHDIDALVDLKVTLNSLIKAVENKEYQTILEKRYLNFLSFEQIAVDLNFSIQHVFRIHKKCLNEIEVIVKKNPELLTGE